MKISAATMSLAFQPDFIKKATSSPALAELSKPLPTSVKPQRDPNEEFYRFEESPWLPKNDKGEIDEIYKSLSAEDIKPMRDKFIENKVKTFQSSICNMFEDFHNFKQQLAYLNPGLAGKHYGFTLSFDENIKITDPDGVLTPAEHTYLTEELNKRKPLKDALITNAKSIMTLLDHYSEKFGTEHTLNLEKFSKVIDYGQVFSRNTIGNFMDTIIYQIERYAPKREVEEESLVDVHA
ncbi:hypothetical protein [Pseudomonas triticifolii]|uniref:hypothetical protein n=1 Tax=Pseudomonas triticifolii TaxID=2762592 RepID=UPI001F3A0698|nr:hypothetical protein [Pseudomonas triticifolii]